ncbi:MAG: ABC transporter permease, partial [Clostridium sp.]
DNIMKVNSLDSNLKENIEVVMKEYFKNGQLRGFEETLSKIEKENMTVAQRSGGFILLTLIVTCTMSACNLIKDKEEGTLKRFYVSPSKASRYIIGTYLYNLINTITQILIAVIVLMIFKLDIGITSMQLFMVGCVTAVIATSLSALIVCLSENELQASIVASVIALIMSLLGGSFLPLDKMPTLLKYISNFTITKWLIVFIEKLQNGLINLEILTPIAIMLSLSIVMIISSCKLGKKKFI